MKKDLYFILLNLLLVIIFLGIFLFFSCKQTNVSYYSNEGFASEMKNSSNKTSKSQPYERLENIPISNYKANSLDIQYHDTIDDINAQVGLDVYTNTINVYDTSGNLVQLSVPAKMANSTYYDPGSMKYESSNFVPTYEDTVYFSKLTGLGYTTPINDTNEQLGGFCLYNKNNVEKIEEKCNNLDKNICASTSCCVLLGNQKCVAGNEQGPTMKYNYSNYLVKDRDYYYYQNKCYGNCPYYDTGIN